MKKSNKTRTKLIDIAKSTGFDISTISRALRGKSGISKENRKKIIEIAKKLKYYPDYLAKGLREKKSYTIGVIINDLENPYYIEILQAINNRLLNEKYLLSIATSDWNLANEKKIIQDFLSKRVDGIIISALEGVNNNLNILMENDVEFIVIDSFPIIDNVNYIYNDHKKGFEISTEYLIKNGHKDILLILGPGQKYYSDKMVLDGFVQTLESHNIQFNTELFIRTNEYSLTQGYEVFKNILRKRLINNFPNFTAIMTNDILAAGIYKAANELNIKIPKDFSIFGNGNINLSEIIYPPLTTIHLPKKRIGLQSIELLLNNLNSENKIKGEKIVFDPYIVERSSVMRI
ncbi:MAG: LacI family transcriptional regulator [Actinobacteria bacterium]|nr:LacI family transcriptional regulator [Actinomycetota bacterium]